MERGADTKNKKFSDIKALQGLLTHVTFGCCNQTQVRVSPTNPTNLKYLGENKMKSIKYTLAALAVIALASVSTAKAQTGAPGDLILGVFNTTNSLAFDLGTYTNLTSGESWDLGTVSSTVGSNLSFSLADTANTSTSGAGGVPKNTILLAGTNIPTGTVPTLTSEFGAIQTAEEAITGSGVTTVAAANGHSSYFELLESASGAGAYSVEDGGNGFGIGSNIDVTWTGSDTADLYSLTKSGTPVEVGVFSTATVGGDTVLTFNSLSATPEPSAYALGLCAVALFFVLKRRRTVA
jgi:hypothetical protein